MAGIDEESSPSPHGGGLLGCVVPAVVYGQDVWSVAVVLLYFHGLFPDK